MTAVAAGSPPKTRSLSISRQERAARVERVREELLNRGLDALVLFHPERIGYLTSFVFVSTERPIALVAPAQGELGILIPQLEQEHVNKAPEIGDVQVYPEYPSGNGGRHPFQYLKDLLNRKGLLGRRLGADSDGYGDINGFVGPTLSEINVEGSLSIARDVVDTLRQVKSPAELDLVRESCTWGNLAHRLLQKHMAIGKTEIEVSLQATSEAILIMLDTSVRATPVQAAAFAIHRSAPASSPARIRPCRTACAASRACVLATRSSPAQAPTSVATTQSSNER